MSKGELRRKFRLHGGGELGLCIAPLTRLLVWRWRRSGVAMYRGLPVQHERAHEKHTYPGQNACDTNPGDAHTLY
jgi:hypothetical protein